MIPVVARLPFMSDAQLGRVYGDRLAKLTLGIEVEVALTTDPEDTGRPLTVEDFRTTYTNPLTFADWISQGSQVAPGAFFSDYDIEPAYGWSTDPAAMGPNTVAFWTALGRPPLDGDSILPPHLQGPGSERPFYDLWAAPIEESTVGYLTLKTFDSTAAHETAGLLALAALTLSDYGRVAGFSARSQVLVDRLAYRLFAVTSQSLRGRDEQRLRADLAERVEELRGAAPDADGARRHAFMADAIDLVERASGVIAEFAFANRTFFNENRDRTGHTTVRQFMRGLTARTPDEFFGNRLITVPASGRRQLERDFQRALAQQEDRDYAEAYRAQADAGDSLKERAVPYIGTLFRERFPGEPVAVGKYHGGKGSKQTRIESDGSIEPAGAEIVSAPQSVAEGLRWYSGVCRMIEDTDELDTNASTGLHANIGTWKHEFRTQGKLGVLPGSIDVLKLLVFLGDRALLSQFGRLNNAYARPMMEALRSVMTAQAIGDGGTAAINRFVEQMNLNLVSAASASRYRTVNLQNLRPHGYLEFRIIGGQNYHGRYPEVRRTIMRFAQVCVIAADQKLYRKQYLIGLYKLLAKANPAYRDMARKTYLPILRAFLSKNASALLAASPVLQAEGVSVTHVPQLFEEALDYDAYGMSITPIERQSLGGYLTAFALVLDRGAHQKLQVVLWRYVMQRLGFHGDAKHVDDRRINLASIGWYQAAEDGVL